MEKIRYVLFLKKRKKPEKKLNLYNSIIHSPLLNFAKSAEVNVSIFAEQPTQSARKKIRNKAIVPKVKTRNSKF